MKSELPAEHKWIEPAVMSAYLHEEIPLTKAMGLCCTAWDGWTVALTTPLGPNLNHADTAFGGSISATAILAGYCLMYLMLRERRISNRLLIQKSEIEFLRPIDADMISTARLPEEKEVGEFIETLQRKRRARLTLVTQVTCKGLLAAKQTGQYLAMVY
jgi:thioesterase domain-containing protein